MMEEEQENSIAGPEAMAAAEAVQGLADEYEDANPESTQGDVVAPADPETTSTLGRDVSSLVGPQVLATLETIYEQRGQNLSDKVSVTDVELDIGRVEILKDADGQPKYMVVYDSEGNNITIQFLEYLGITSDEDDGRKDLISQAIGEPAFIYGDILRRSTQGEQYQSGRMGVALDEVLEDYIANYQSGLRREAMSKTLTRIRGLMSSLSKSFAFDDYRHLEVFMAAWLMKDSTCRLSGVPGTGKTTVIECAATLFSNSYGFNSVMRVCAPQDYVASSESEIYNSNTSKENIYTPQPLPTGQVYHISYGNISRPELKSLWERWRFTDWSRPKDIGGDFQYTGKDSKGRPYQQLSGAYLYDFRYMQPQYQEGDDSHQKVALQPQTFRELLLQHYYADVPANCDVDDPATWPDYKEGVAVVPQGSGKKRLVKPVKILDADGLVRFPNYVEITEDITDSEGNVTDTKKLIFNLAYPDMNASAVSRLMSNITDILGRSAENVMKDYMEESTLDGIWTDAGRNEGYWLREFLHYTCYDARASPNAIGQTWTSLSAEMLAEIGIAKVDYEKRADEVLYGMEIRETQGFDPAKGANVNTFDFEPVPRPIVTQPVKFFNEANRSKPGMEDAILGLIAERKVEYRGKEFDSPNFVAWMDTNPHQKGNDLAFTDRIDMEILFKSVSLGGRYNIMAGGAMRPVQQLIENMTLTGATSPLRFRELRAIWNEINDKDSGILLTQPGGSYDGFRDVAVVSVMFSQAYRTRRKNVYISPSADANQSWVNNPHESPLVDYSTTTNTRSKPKGGNESAVLDDAYGRAAYANKLDANAMQAGAKDIQVPAIFTRVLGFRFTNSLIKLSKAFAFLRGKTYVSRKDIVDAVPYTCAHRIGRSREGLTDMEGNTKGIETQLAMDMGYNNEQDFLREVLVNGYINRDVDVGQGKGASLLELLDSFYERCVSLLQSSEYAWQYEELVLSQLQKKFISAGDGTKSLANQLTPVHWHIATMVSDSERNGKTTLREYGEGASNYPSMYESYMRRISTPAPKGVGEACLNDLFALRYEIVNERNLFSDDKARLISLCDEEISIFASDMSNEGKSYLNSSTSSTITGDAIGAMGIKSNLPLLSYGDTLGAWASTIGSKPEIDNMKSFAVGAGGNTIQGNLITDSKINSAAMALSGQQMKIIGRLQQGTGTSTDEFARFKRSLSRFTNQMQPYILGGGAQILNNANTGGILEQDWVRFMSNVRETVKNSIDGFNQPQQYFPDASNPTDAESINWGDEGQGYKGMSACFPLKHIDIPTDGFTVGDVQKTIQTASGTQTVTRPARYPPNGDESQNLWENRSHDHLRLWVSMISLGKPEEVGDDKFQTFIFTATITSNLGIYHPVSADGIRTEDTGTIDFVPMSNKQVLTTNWPDNCADAGNMTKTDRLEYMAIMGSALHGN